MQRLKRCPQRFVCSVYYVSPPMARYRGDQRSAWERPAVVDPLLARPLPGGKGLRQPRMSPADPVQV